MGCLRFGVLGPLELWRHEQRIELTAGKQRAVLAMLVLRAGEAVTVDQLVAAVWDGRPPATARRTLQSLVSRLRQALACGTGAVLVRQTTGYRLAVRPDQVDAQRFGDLVSAAGAAIGQRRVGDAAASLRRALGLWRGAALADVPRTVVLEAEAVRLEEQRLAALDSLVDADLQLGRHAELLGELHAATTRWPMRERCWEQLMLALYRSGRRADALAAYQRARATLRAELGVEPGPALRDLHRRVLAAEPTLVVPPAEPVPAQPVPPARPTPVRPASAGPAAAVPPAAPPTAAEPSAPADLPAARQLPSDVAGFAGRAGYLAQLDTLLPGSGDPARPVAVSVIDGAAGVGKTALAVHWAHRERERFPDGQLFVDLRGYAHRAPMPPVEVLAGFLTALGMPADQVPTELDQAAAAYRSRLAGRRMLVVLDNAASAGQVRPLLPGDGGCAVLVTSREQLGGLVARDGARRLTLDVLPGAEARTMLTGLLGAQRAAAEPDALAELARACGYLPLALRLVAASLTGSAGLRIADQVARLHRPDWLAALAAAGDPHGSVAAAFGLSYTRQPAPVRRMFRLLGLVPGPDASQEAAASLAGTTPERAGRLLHRLVDAHLLEQPTPGRYRCHDLLRCYAADRVAREECPAARRAARDRLYAFYVRTTDAAAQVAFPGRSRVPRPELPGPVLAPAPASAPAPAASASESPSSSFDGSVAALAWLDREWANLVAAVQYATAHGRPRSAWIIADYLRQYCWLRIPAEWATIARAGLAAAEADGDRPALAAGHLNLAHLAWRQGRFRQAADSGAVALRLVQGTGWTEGQAAAHFQLAATCSKIGDFQGAAAHHRQGLRLAERIGWRRGQANAHTNLGSTLIERGLLAQAIGHTRRALTMTVEIGAPLGQAINLINLGTIHYLCGRYRPAGAALDRAHALCQSIGNSSTLCNSRRWLAALHLATGHYQTATGLASSAIALAHDQGNPLFEADARTLLAAVHERLDQLSQAIDEGHLALELAERSNGALSRTEARIGLATAHLRAGDPEQAQQYAGRALVAAREIASPLLEAEALTALAMVRLASHQPGQAIVDGEQALAIHLEVGHRFGAGRTHLVLGQARRQTGDSDAARGHRRAAAAVCTGLGVPEAALGIPAAALAGG